MRGSVGASLNLDNRRIDGPAFDTAAFQTLSTGQFQFPWRAFATTFSNLPANGTNGLSLSQMKGFRLMEKVRFQLRGEACNTVNHPVFSSPNPQAANSLYGYITSQANRPRTLPSMSGLAC